jgi:hypothetical protein
LALSHEKEFGQRTVRPETLLPSGAKYTGEWLIGD